MANIYEGEGSCSFNSLFEMLARMVNEVLGREAATFNSLFEMPPAS